MIFQSFFSHKKKQWDRSTIDNALHRNGYIIERARQRTEDPSLTYEERMIIISIRNLAKENGFSRTTINAIEMEGEHDRDRVYEPLKIVAKFSYWTSASYGFAAVPSYIIMQSNHPALPEGGTVDIKDLERLRVKVPKTPTFEAWDKKGRPCYRGE